MLRIKKWCLQSVEKNLAVKLVPQFYEPFKIVHNINDVAFKLDLPSH